MRGARAADYLVLFGPISTTALVGLVDVTPLTVTARSEPVRVRHINLGEDGDKARRTGAFINHGRHVPFTTGKGRVPHWCCSTPRPPSRNRTPGATVVRGGAEGDD